MVKYIFTNKAVEDLTNIWNYTFEVWSENQADKYYELIIVACKESAEEKLCGKNYPEIMQDILGLKIGQHIIFYRKVGTQSIDIVRLLHSRMDLRNRIQE